MVAIEIEVGMISAGQTVTVMAQDGQFGQAIGGKDPHGRTPDHGQQIHRYGAYATQIPRSARLERTGLRVQFQCITADRVLRSRDTR